MLDFIVIKLVIYTFSCKKQAVTTTQTYPIFCHIVILGSSFLSEKGTIRLPKALLGRNGSSYIKRVLSRSKQDVWSLCLCIKLNFGSSGNNILSTIILTVAIYIKKEIKKNNSWEKQIETRTKFYSARFQFNNSPFFILHFHLQVNS